MPAVLPTRHETPRSTVSVTAATIYANMPRHGTVNAVWEKVSRKAPYIHFQEFVGGLTLLYAAGLVDTDADYTVLRRTA